MMNHDHDDHLMIISSSRAQTGTVFSSCMKSIQRAAMAPSKSKQRAFHERLDEEREASATLINSLLTLAPTTAEVRIKAALKLALEDGDVSDEE